MQVPGIKSYPCSCQGSMEELTWEGKNLQSETLSPADMSCHGSDYGIDVLTNLDSDIFESSAPQTFSEKTDRTVFVALRTRNIATKREKILPKPQGSKYQKSITITKSTKYPDSSTDKFSILTHEYFRDKSSFE